MRKKKVKNLRNNKKKVRENVFPPFHSSGVILPFCHFGFHGSGVISLFSQS